MATNGFWAPDTPLEPLTAWDADRLRWWHGEPESYAVDEGRLTVVARPGRDWWRRTFYDPALDKRDGPAYLCRVPARHAYACLLYTSPSPRDS